MDWDYQWKYRRYLFQKGDYDIAMNYLKEDCRSSMLHHEFFSALQSYMAIQDILIRQNKHELAQQYLDTSYRLYQRILTENPQDTTLLLSTGRDIFNALGRSYYYKKSIKSR